MKHQINSFKVAFKGILYTIKSESHMRFHMAAGFYVILFSFFYNLSTTQWAVVIMLIGLVMVAEVFNTCLEELCNLSTQSYDPIARVAKDIAAGAVLILALISIVVAILFYFDLAVISGIIAFFIANPILLVLLLLSFIGAILFVGYGPKKAFSIYHKHKAKK